MMVVMMKREMTARKKRNLREDARLKHGRLWIYLGSLITGDECTISDEV